MPLQFKNIAVGNLQDDVSGNNYAANKAVYILNLNNTLAQIYSDEAGLTPIVQDGVNNVTNSKGVFGFWVEAGDYFVQVGANKYRVSITGADYFNNRIDETVDLIVDSVAGRGAYYPVGSFEAGFTYTDINQVGTFGGTDYYIYTRGLTNLPHPVTAGTNPTLSSDYAQVFYTDHGALINRDLYGAHPSSAISHFESAVQDVIEGVRGTSAQYNTVRARVNRAALFESAGSISVLGDSITVGEGATSLSSSFASLLSDALANTTSGGYGYGNEINFNFATAGNIALSGQTAGTSGPIQRSQIIAVNGTITISRPNATRIAFFYDRTTTSGSVEVRQNGALITTIDCSGANQKTVLSPYVTISEGGNDVQFLVTGSPVEFLAMVPIRDNPNQPLVPSFERMAVSGWNSSDFLNNADQLISASEAGSIGGGDSIFILAIGTNDIYTAARSPASYASNLRSIGETLQSFRPANRIVLVVPPVSELNPAIPQFTHADYARAIYNLSYEKLWPVIDLSNLQLEEQSFYVDGVHPTDRGHQIIASAYCDALGLDLRRPVTFEQQQAINERSDADLRRVSFDMTTFTGGLTRTKTLTSAGITSSDFITGIYIRWKTSGVMIPIEHCQDFAGTGNGIQLLRSFSGQEYSVANLIYSSPSNDGTGFANPQGPLSSSILNTVAGYNDSEVIVEFIRSFEIS